MLGPCARAWAHLRAAGCELVVTSERGQPGEGAEIWQYGLLIGQGRGETFRRAMLSALIEAVQVCPAEAAVPSPHLGLVGGHRAASA
jgi:hypothetical protein